MHSPSLGAPSPSPSHVHIPYRDSKLTRLLAPALSAGRCALLCTVSPAGSQAEVTRATLALAARAMAVTTTARVNRVGARGGGEGGREGGERER